MAGSAGGEASASLEGLLLAVDEKIGGDSAAAMRWSELPSIDNRAQGSAAILERFGGVFEIVAYHTDWDRQGTRFAEDEDALLVFVAKENHHSADEGAFF